MARVSPNMGFGTQTPTGPASAVTLAATDRRERGVTAELSLVFTIVAVLSIGVPSTRRVLRQSERRACFHFRRQQRDMYNRYVMVGVTGRPVPSPSARRLNKRSLPIACSSSAR